MTDTYVPTPEATQKPIEAKEENFLIHAIRDFRDRFFPVKKNQEKIPETDDLLIERLHEKHGLKITPQELSEIRRSANGVGLVDNAGTLKFVGAVPTILSDLEKIHGIEKAHAEKLKDPLKLKRWQAEVSNEIEWALATYAAKYSAKQEKNYNPIIDEGLTLRLRDNEISAESELSVEAVPQEHKSNVIRMADHPHKPTQPIHSEKTEEDGPEPTQPKTSVA